MSCRVVTMCCGVFQLFGERVYGVMSCRDDVLRCVSAVRRARLRVHVVDGAGLRVAVDVRRSQRAAVHVRKVRLATQRLSLTAAARV